MPFIVYVLYSIKFNKIDIGYTADLQSRIDSHNLYAKKGYTLRYRPWEIIYTESYHTKKEAMTREQQLKAVKDREYELRYSTDTQQLNIANFQDFF